MIIAMSEAQSWNQRLLMRIRPSQGPPEGGPYVRFGYLRIRYLRVRYVRIRSSHASASRRTFNVRLKPDTTTYIARATGSRADVRGISRRGTRRSHRVDMVKGLSRRPSASTRLACGN